MNTVQVKNTVIGEGRPKICVPIVGKAKTDILEEAKKITTLPVDVVEWRVDWFDDVFATEKVLETAKELQEVLKDIPVLLTFRTSKAVSYTHLDVYKRQDVGTGGEDHGACDSEMGEHHLSEILIEYFLSILYGKSCILKGKSLKLRDIVFFCL